MSAQIRFANGNVPPGGSHVSVYVSTCSFGGAFGATRYAYRLTVTETRLLPCPAAAPTVPASSTTTQPSTVTRLIASTIRRRRADSSSARAGSLGSS
jgi:hypothetical protein